MNKLCNYVMLILKIMLPVSAFTLCIAVIHNIMCATKKLE
jgi:hypothetical protein